jgi:hypothetical protein
MALFSAMPEWDADGLVLLELHRLHAKEIHRPSLEGSIGRM